MSDTSVSGPQRFGRYAVRRRIGSGGFATVWLAYDEQLDAPVAVKVLADNWTHELHVRTRFVEEGRYLRRVESPHVVTVYDAGELPDGRPYLVMTYADQGTLADRLEGGTLTVGQSLEVVRQVAAGLQALHDRGILHRDVKPGNVLFRTTDGTDGDEVRVMLGDLGLGKAMDVSSRLTMIAGSPAYVAPEQAQGEPPDARADQYSLAVLTYLLLTGRRPWDHATLNAAARPTAPPPMSTPEQQFPPAVEDVVTRALSLDRGGRYASVTQYVESLTSALSGWDGLAGGAGTRLLQVDPHLTQPGARPSPLTGIGSLPDAVPETAPHRRRRRVLKVLGVALALVVALAAGGAAGYVGEQEADPAPSTAPVTLQDENGTLEVTVPRDWDADARGEWHPPNAERDQMFAALSVGTSDTWTADGEGVFLGVLPGDELPTTVPQHKQCASSSAQVKGEFQGFASVTTTFTDCAPGDAGGAAGVIVERVVQIADTQLLWVQVRSAEQATANRVLDSVHLYGR